MHPVVDLNPGSGCIYGRSTPENAIGSRLNALVDEALIAANQQEPPRDYLGASRVGEPCARKLVYEYTRTPKDDRKDFGGGILRIFDAGHQFEDSASGGSAPPASTSGPATAKASSSASRSPAAASVATSTAPSSTGRTSASAGRHCGNTRRSVRSRGPTSSSRGVRAARPICFAQVQLYMAYMDLPVALFTATNRDSLLLHHEIVPFDAAEAQALSDKAVEVIRSAEAGELPPRIAEAADFHLCRRCDFTKRCWDAAA